MLPGQRRPRRRTAKDHGPDPVDIHVGRQVRLARELTGLTQVEVGKRLGMSFQVIQKYEQGEIRVSASRLYQLARLFERSVGFFFRPRQDPAACGGRCLVRPARTRTGAGLPRHRQPRGSAAAAPTRREAWRTNHRRGSARWANWFPAQKGENANTTCTLPEAKAVWP